MVKHFATDPAVCSDGIDVEIDENNVVTKCNISGGCPGNLEGISKIVIGMRAEEVIARFEGIRCGGKSTSCPDQLAKILKSILN